MPASPPKRSPPDIPPEKKRLVDENLSYVRAIAAKVKEHLPKEIEFDDLVAYGTQGLLEAAARFDTKQGASFTTFAYYRVRGAIFDGLRGMGWLSRGEYSRTRVEERASAYLQNLAEREVGAQTYGAGGRDVEDEVRDLASALGGVAAIFVTALDQDDERAMRDETPAAPERLEQRETESAVQKVVSALPDKERSLIEMYYFRDKTLEEAGAALGLSKSWASRLHARAIDLIKEGLARFQPELASARKESPRRKRSRPVSRR